MARQTIVTLTDDLDGGPADETVRFGIDGSRYEIDLSGPNAATLRQQLAPFIERARPAGSASRGPRRTAASRRRSREIRAWARDQGIELSERGRIPARVADRYLAAAAGTTQALPARYLRFPRGPGRSGITVPTGTIWGAKVTGRFRSWPALCILRVGGTR